MQAAAEADLRRQDAADAAARSQDALTNIGILRRDAARYERRWQDRVGSAFVQWPQSSKVAALDGYSLVSDGELQAQLIGQPVIEALERRFVDVLDTIDRRLWSLAASLGGVVRPSNPFAPRVLVEAMLATFPVAECDPGLRQLMLRQFERLCFERLGEVFGWVNTQLADAGHALAGASDYALLVAQTAATTRDPSVSWGHENALAPTQSSWRGQGGGEVPRQSTRGNALREHVRRARGTPAPTTGRERRIFSDQEFLSVLSLLQGSETPQRPAPIGASIHVHLRDSLLQGAANLGMPRETSAPSPAQDDAVDIVGRLFDGLRRNACLAPSAHARLARLAYPYLRLALDDAGLFDDDAHLALAVLDELLEAWDGNTGAGEADAGLHALADAVADDIANDYHGDAQVFDKARAALLAGLEPLRRRAEVAERRVWQALLGRERLQSARAAADAELATRIEGRDVLVTVGGFLSDQWRQSLVHAWLREGPESARFRDAVALGDAILQVDAQAAQALGHAVAEGLIALEQPLRDCHVACGLDESGANGLLAGLVAEIARPDAKRSPVEFTPLAGDGPERTPRAAPDAGTAPLEPGQVVLERQPDGDLQWRRLAWISPVSGQLLLVNRQGQRQSLLDAETAAAEIAAGGLVPRPMLRAVDAVLRPLHAAAAD